jgi:hypothetical protein
MPLPNLVSTIWEPNAEILMGLDLENPFNFQRKKTTFLLEHYCIAMPASNLPTLGH